MKKSRILYAFVCLCLFIFAATYWNYLSFLALVSSLVLPLLLFLQLRAAAKKVSIHFQLQPDSISRGEHLYFEVIYKNAGRVPVSHTRIMYTLKNVYYGDLTHQILTLPIFSKNEQTLQEKIVPLHAGVYKFEVQSVLLFDFLKLFSIALPAEEKFSVAVKPALLNTSAQLGVHFFRPALESNTFSRVFSGYDPSEILKLRPYRPGDRLNRIHWKLSAKEDTFIVREPALSIHNTIHIYLELHANETASKQDIDSLLETFCVLSMLFLDGEIEHFVHWYDSEQKNMCQAQIRSQQELYSTTLSLLRSPCYFDGCYALDHYSEDMFHFGTAQTIYITPFVRELMLQKLKRQQIENMTILYTHDFRGEKVPDLHRYGIKGVYIDSSNPAAALDQLVL